MKKCKNGQHLLNWKECGYGGGSMADVWCNKCHGFIGVPIEIYKEKQPYLYKLWLLHNKYGPNDKLPK